MNPTRPDAVARALAQAAAGNTAKNVGSLNPIDMLVLASSMFYKESTGQELSAARAAVLKNSMEQMLDRGIKLNKIRSAEDLVSSLLSKDTVEKMVTSGFIKSAPTVSQNPGAVDTPVAMLFNLLSILVPNFAYMEAAAVQPMPSEQSPLYFPQLVANTTRNGVTAGDNLLTATTWNSNNQFTSNRYKAWVPTYSVGSAAVTGTAPMLPILKSATVQSQGTAPVQANFVVTLYKTGSPGTYYTTTDDGNGNILAVAGAITSGTINYTTGALSITLAANIASGDTISIDFRYDLDQQSPAQALFEFSSKLVTAFPRRIRSKYALDNFFAAKKVLDNYNLDEVLSSSMAGYINKEISGGVFDDMAAAATGTYTWSSSLPSGVSWAFHRLSLLQPVVQASNAIRKNTARHAGNVWVVGTNWINQIETLGSDLWAPKSYEREPIGPYVAGTLAGKFKVIKNQDFSDSQSIMSFKADDTDASYAVGVFIGLYATDPIALDDLNVIQGMGTKIGQVQVFPNSIANILYT